MMNKKIRKGVSMVDVFKRSGGRGGAKQYWSESEQ